MLSVVVKLQFVMLSVVLLQCCDFIVTITVVILNVVMLSVVAPLTELSVDLAIKSFYHCNWSHSQ